MSRILSLMLNYTFISIQKMRLIEQYREPHYPNIYHLLSLWEKNDEPHSHNISRNDYKIYVVYQCKRHYSSERHCG